MVVDDTMVVVDNTVVAEDTVVDESSCSMVVETFLHLCG